MPTQSASQRDDTTHPDWRDDTTHPDWRDDTTTPAREIRHDTSHARGLRVFSATSGTQHGDLRGITPIRDEMALLCDPLR
nr:hypothetical protein [Roseobacter litoralis]